MSRGFLVGLFWGTVASLLGLGVISLVLPLAAPPAPPAEIAEASPVPEEVTATPEEPEAPAAEADAAPAPEVQLETEAALGAAPAPEAVPAPEPKPEPAQAAAAEPVPAPALRPSVAPAEPRELAMEVDSAPAPVAPEAETAPTVPKAPPAEPETALADAGPTLSEGTMPAPKQDKLLEPPAAPATPAAEVAPEVPSAEAAAPETVDAETLPEVPALPPAPAPVADVTQPPAPEAPEAPASSPENSPPAAPAEDAAEEPAAASEGMAPATTARKLPGVGANRLPGLGSDAQPALEAGGDGEATAEAASPEDGAVAEVLPIVAHARPFEPDPDRPRFAVVLQDIGAAGMSRADLAALPFAVTFAVDPMAPDAAEAAQAYRAAGQEVVIMAGPLPKGATPADLEQIFQAIALNLPETVALLDAPAGGLQEDRPLATQAIPILKAQGRGIVTFDRGLGAAEQVAAREGLAHAAIFRSLDADGESVDVIRRYLDRAAFKAAQEGQVVVFGQTRPETVAALMEWMVEGRGASVQLAPITAVMAQD